jgi:hypothetical protein
MLVPRHSLVAQPLYLYAPGPLRICNERWRITTMFLCVLSFFPFICPLSVHGCTDTDAGTDAEATGAYKYTPSTFPRTFLAHVGVNLVLVRFLTE